MDERPEPRPEAEGELEDATLGRFAELLETREWEHRTQYLAEIAPLIDEGLSRTDAAARVLANHASWQAEVHPIREKAERFVLSERSETAGEALQSRLELAANEAGIVEADRLRYVEQTARRLRELPYVRARFGPSDRFPESPGRGDVYGSFRAEDNVEGRWWELVGELEEDEHGRPTIRRLLVEPHPHMDPAGAEVSPTVLRGLRLPLIRERALRELSEAATYRTAGLVRRAEALVKQLGMAPPRQGRAGYPDELFEVVAIHYVLLKRKHGVYGLSRRLARLEKRMLGRHVAEGTVKDWVREAARRGYLEKGPASWELGPKLRDQDNGQQREEEQ